MSRHRIHHHSGRFEVRFATGVTLVELMVSMAVGLLVMIAATALLISTKSGYQMQDDDAQIQATGRFAIEAISRAVRQAAYENWDPSDGPVVAASSVGQSVFGLDARSLKSGTPGIDSPVAKSVNGSDVLAIRFFGSGAGNKDDRTMMNCAGFGVAAVPSGENAEDGRGWSIFYVAEDATGEPELYCKYQGDSGWSSQAIARGIESLQVLYGLDTDDDGLPNRFVNASAINALDDTLVLAGNNATERAADRKRKSFWKKVVAVKVGLLVRGTHRTRNERPTAEYDLFGKDYADLFSAEDPGVRIREAKLPKLLQGKERKIFAATIYCLIRRTPPSKGPR